MQDLKGLDPESCVWAQAANVSPVLGKVPAAARDGVFRLLLNCVLSICCCQAWQSVKLAASKPYSFRLLVCGSLMAD